MSRIRFCEAFIWIWAPPLVSCSESGSMPCVWRITPERSSADVFVYSRAARMSKLIGAVWIGLIAPAIFTGTGRPGWLSSSAGIVSGNAFDISTSGRWFCAKYPLSRSIRFSAVLTRWISICLSASDMP